MLSAQLSGAIEAIHGLILQHREVFHSQFEITAIGPKSIGPERPSHNRLRGCGYFCGRAFRPDAFLSAIRRYQSNPQIYSSISRSLSLAILDVCDRIEELRA
jgi:hypothetical protein